MTIRMTRTSSQRRLLTASFVALRVTPRLFNHLEDIKRDEEDRHFDKVTHHFTSRLHPFFHTHILTHTLHTFSNTTYHDNINRLPRSDTRSESKVHRLLFRHEGVRGESWIDGGKRFLDHTQ